MFRPLKRKLAERGVTQIAHFAPLYKFQVMKQLGYDTASIQASCPHAEDVFANRFTHVPIYGLTAAQVKYLGDSVIESVEELQRDRDGNAGYYTCTVSIGPLLPRTALLCLALGCISAGAAARAPNTSSLAAATCLGG